MRVKMITTLSNVRQTWLEGEQYELPDETARQWIKSKVAAETTEVPSALKPKRAAK